MDPMDMSRQTSNSKLVSDGGSNQLQQTLTTITANTTGTNSSGDNVSTFSAGDRAKKSSGVLIQAGLRASPELRQSRRVFLIISNLPL